MCDPVIGTIVSAAMTVGGQMMAASEQAAAVEAQNAAQRQAMEMSRAARQAELARQEQYEQEARAMWDKSREDLTRDARDTKQTTAEDQFKQRFEEQPNKALADGMFLSGQENASAPVREVVAGQIAEGAAEGRRRAAALARLSAYGTVENQNNIAIGQTNSNLQTLGGIRRGSLGVSQFEQAVPAARVFAPSTSMGDIISGAGGMIGKASGQGVFGDGGGGPRLSIGPSLY
jgi:hypothetical protein